MQRLAGKTAIVTGAAQGLGLAIAKRFANEGARLLLVDLNQNALEAVAADLNQLWFCANVGDCAAVKAMVAHADDVLGSIDILVNNAGIAPSSGLLDVDEPLFDRVMAVNVKSVLFAMQSVAPQMIARKSGSIVNVASVAAVLGSPLKLVYCVSKAAVMQLTNVAALELAPHGVRVNAIGPGTFETEMALRTFQDHPGIYEQSLSRTPMGRLGRPEEAADIVLFLASDESSYVTGKTIFADGGRMGLNLTMPE